MKKRFIYLALSIVSLHTLCACHSTTLVRNDIRLGDELVDVINHLGPPCHQCYKAGLPSYKEKISFGLQWGIDPAKDVILGDIYTAEITVWFDSDAKVVEVRADGD